MCIRDRIYIKAVNDSASAQRRLVINQTGSLNGTDPATGNSIIIAHGDDSVVLFSRTDGTNFTGYDVVASHLPDISASNFQFFPRFFDRKITTAGVTTHTVSSMGGSAQLRYGITTDTTDGAQDHSFAAAWLADQKEILVNRRGLENVTIRFDDGTKINGLDFLVLQRPGFVVLRAEEDANGDISVAVEVALSDVGGPAGTAVSVNQAPIALGDVITVVKNSSLRFPLQGVDVDGIAGAPTITQPDHGTVTVVSDNVIQYTPNTDYVGVDEFTFTVVDNDGDTSGDGVISVNVIETQASYRGSVFPDAQTTSLDKITIEGHADPRISNNIYVRYGIAPDAYWMEAGA